MASTERSCRMARICVVCLMFLPIHTLPLMAAEKAVEKPVVISEAPQQKSMAKKLVGIASYYANKYHGRKTTSGQRYHPDKMTAAHQSLPFGARVLVRNLANNKEVTVVINDRCRKKSIPFIDLSRAAAKKLGFFGAGTAKVVMILLPNEES